MGASFSTSTVFRGVDRMSPVFDKMSKRTSRFGDILKATLSANLIMGGFNRLIGGLKAGTEAFINFETAMAKVSTIADTNAMSMDQQSDAIMRLSNQTGKSVSELAEAQYQALSAGVDTANSINFVETAVKAATGGFTDATTAVDGLTSVLNAYSLEAMDATRISDEMLATQNFGKTTFGDMAQSMGGVIPIASALKLETFELFGSIAALTKQGIQTPEAMVGIKAALSNILKPAEQASKMATKLGLDFSVAALQSKGLAGFLEDVSDKTGGSQEKMAQLFGSVRALNTVMALTKNGGADMVAAFEAVKNSTGATDAAFAKMTDTFGFRWQAVKNRFTNVSIGMADSLSPLLGMMLDIAEKVDFDALNAQLSGFMEGLNLDNVADKMIQFIDEAIVKIPEVVSDMAEMMPMIKEFANQMGYIVGFIAEGVGRLSELASGPVYKFLKFGFQGGVIGAIKRKFEGEETEQEAPNQAEANSNVIDFNQVLNLSGQILGDSETSINGAPPVKKDFLGAS